VVYNSTCSEYNITISGIPSGTYNYYWYANDSYGKNAVPYQENLTIKKAWNQTDSIIAGEQYQYDLNVLGIPVTKTEGSRSQDTSKITESDGYAYNVLPISIYNNGSAYGVDPTTFTNIITRLSACPSGWTCDFTEYNVSSLTDGQTNTTNITMKKLNVIYDTFSTIEATDSYVTVGQKLNAVQKFIVNNTDTIPYTNVKVDVSEDFIDTWTNDSSLVTYVDIDASSTKIISIPVHAITVEEVSYLFQREDFNDFYRYTYKATLNVTEQNLTKNLPIHYIIPSSRLTDWSIKYDYSVTVDGSSKDLTMDGTTLIIGTNHSSSSLEYGTHVVTITYHVARTPVSGGGGGVAYIPSTNETVYIPNIESNYPVPLIISSRGANIEIIDENNNTVYSKYVKGTERITLNPGNYTIKAEQYGRQQYYKIELKYPSIVEINVNKPLKQYSTVEGSNKYLIYIIILGIVSIIITFRDEITERMREIWERYY